MIKKMNGFTLICMRCYHKDQTLGDCHIHAVADQKGAFIRSKCFKCGNVDEVRVASPEPKNRKDAKRLQES